MANDSRFRRTAGRVDGPDFANYWRAPALPPASTVFSHVVRDVLAVRRGAVAASTSAMFAALNAGRDDGPVLHLARITRGGAAAGGICGVGPLLRFDKWNAGQWDDGAAGNDFTDDSEDARDLGAADVPMLINGVGGGFGAGDGILVGASEVWSLLRLTVSTADGGAGAANINYVYWNGAAWSALTPIGQTGTLGVGGTHLVATGLREALFAPPADWTASTGAAPGEGVPAGLFLVRLRYTVAAPAVAPVFSRLEVGHPLMIATRGLATDSQAELVAPGSEIPIGDAGDGVVAAWDSTSANNGIICFGEDVGYVGTLGSTHGG